MSRERALGIGAGGWQVPVLMYHDLSESPARADDPHGPYVVTAAVFREHLGRIASSGLRGTPLSHLLQGERMEPPDGVRVCVLTFDDGHESNHRLALPLLLEAGFGATFFVTVGWVGRSPYLTWDEIRELASAGMEIGSHSMTHRPPASLTRPELLAEMVDSKRLLEDRLGRPVLSASCPTGFFNRETVSVAREAGYRALCVGRVGLWKDAEDRFRIPRLPVKWRTDAEDVGRMILGDRRLLASMRARQMVLDIMKSALGVSGYRRVRCGLFRLLGRGVREPRS